MSIYQRKLELLVDGYTKQHSNGSIPFALLKAIIQWHSKEPQLMVNILQNGYEFLLECYLNEPSNNLLNIDKYILSYTIKNDDIDNNNDSKQKIIQCVDNNYFIGFFASVKRTLNGAIFPNTMEVTALDESNNALIKSKTFEITSWYRSCGGLPPRKRLFVNMNFDIIDINHNGYVNLNEWISAMKRLNIGFNELLYIRIFCYMNFEANCYQNLKVKNHQLVMFLRQNHIKWKNKDYGEIVKVLRTICFS